MTRVLIMGVGNILYQDEGLGVHAVNSLRESAEWPENVRLLDGGTLGLRLMEEIMDCDILLVLDAVLAGHEPGSVYRMEEEALRGGLGAAGSAHKTDLADTLIYCGLLGKKPKTVVFGMEPLVWRELGTELTPTVRSQMPKLCKAVLDELESLGITPLPEK